MTSAELALLCTPSVRGAIEERLSADPFRIALETALPHAALVATQVKYLARARRKLPTYYAARAVLPARAFEQASSERAAAHKALEGRTCLDVTCGLGVDALYLARRFERVVALEADPVLADVARENLRRMGVDRVEVITTTAEAFLAQPGLHFDALYADPDRRTKGHGRSVLPEECSPDVRALLPRLLQVADRLLFKFSPLYDVQEAFRCFPAPCRVEAVSIAGECKELLVEPAAAGPARLTATALGEGFCTVEWPVPVASATSWRPAYGYLIVPDAALRKARLVQHCASMSPATLCAPTEQGFLYTDDPPRGAWPGRPYRIEHAARFERGTLRRALRAEGAERAGVIAADFGIGAEEAARLLGLRPGGEPRVALTRIDGRKWAFSIKPLSLPYDRED